MKKPMFLISFKKFFFHKDGKQYRAVLCDEINLKDEILRRAPIGGVVLKTGANSLVANMTSIVSVVETEIEVNHEYLLKL